MHAASKRKIISFEVYCALVLMQLQIAQQYGFNFDVDDMFDDRLMPMQILSQHELTKWFTNSNSTSPAQSASSPSSSLLSPSFGKDAEDMHDAWLMGVGPSVRGFDFNSALNSMDYHRRMMNEFMVNDYVTQQILHDALKEEVNGSAIEQHPPPPPPPHQTDDSFPIGSGGGNGGGHGVVGSVGGGGGGGGRGGGSVGINKRIGEVKSDVDAINSKHATNLTQENNKGNNNNNHTATTTHQQHANSNHKLLNDEGMTRYKTWLRRYAQLNKLPATSSSSPANAPRSSTLKDIQKQLHAQLSRKDAAVKRKHNSRMAHEKMDLTSNYAYDEDEPAEEFEEGDITGYALTTNPYDYVNTPAHSTMPQQNWLLTNEGMEHGTTLDAAALNLSPLAKVNAILHNKNSYDSSFDDYSSSVYHAPPSPPQHAPPVDDSHTAPAASSGKEIGLKDITDIALTTLAFLSFGMFILQVLMCITMGKDDSSNMMMMPMEATESSEMMNDGVEEVRRRKRRSPLIEDSRLLMMNDLARRVLFSVDAALQMPKDNGVCNYWSLCENNRYARKQNNGQRYWIPIWSLGLSWFSSRVERSAELSAQSDYLTIIQSLKAIAIGLATDKCEQYYANACAGMTAS